MNGRQMLDDMVRISAEYRTHPDLEYLKLELRGIVPTLKTPGFSGNGQPYRDALDIYNALRENFPEGTSGIPPIYAGRRL